MEQSKTINLESKHQPVLLKEVVEALNLEDGQIVVDGTLGLGGYSEAVLASGKKLKVVAFELDSANLDFAKERLGKYQGQLTVIHDNFANIKSALSEQGIEEIDGLMLDLGLASPQVDLPERGFSFSKDGELDMRFNKDQSQTAADVINNYSAEQLARIFKEYGEERYAYNIANSIVQRRSEKKFERTVELADFIVSLTRGKKGKIHPATKVFQALRIEVNQELQSLEQVLNDSADLIKQNGRIAVVSYHSLEDRIVKNFFREAAREFINLPNELTTRYLKPKFRLLNKKPIVPGSEEIRQNPRARSAKLRVAEKI
jgi:16S rRNA (cytosine1402-N4)-methyltransferase